MMFEVLRRSILLGLLSVCAVLIFSASGFATVIFHDDFETADPAWVPDWGQGFEISGGKLRTSYDSWALYNGVNLLDLHAGVDVTPNVGSDPNNPIGVHLAILARGHNSSESVDNVQGIMGNLLTRDPHRNPHGNFIYFHEFGPGFSPQFHRTNLGQDLVGEVTMELWVEGNEVVFQVTDSTGFSASISHTLFHFLADHTKPGAVGVFSSNTYGVDELKEPGAHQEWDNFWAEGTIPEPSACLLALAGALGLLARARRPQQ